MTIDPDLVVGWNAVYPRLRLSADRSKELALELDQLRRAAEHVRNSEPDPDDLLDFRATLLALARPRTR